MLLGLTAVPSPDHAADALAVAICHANHAPLGRAWRAGPDDRPVAAMSRSAAPTTWSSRPRRASATGSRCRARRCAMCPRSAAGLAARALIVRDDALNLYGFATEEERDLFLLLIGVQSVGAEGGAGGAGGGTPRELLRALAAGDVARFQAVPGSASGRRSGSSSSCARRSASADEDDGPIVVAPRRRPAHARARRPARARVHRRRRPRGCCAARRRHGRGALAAALREARR